MTSDPDAEIDDYLRDASRERRKKMHRAAAVMAAGAVAIGALSTRMSDMGHFTGFAALAGAMLFGAAALVIEARRR